MHSATLFEFLKPGLNVIYLFIFIFYLFIYLFVRNRFLSKDLRNVRYITHGTGKEKLC